MKNSIDWGSASGNFGGFCNVIAGKACMVWFQKSVASRVIDRWLRACLAGRLRANSHIDATSQILKAEYVPEESFFSYENLCQRYFREHGLPQAFYSDRFSVFRVNRGDQLSYEPAGMPAHNFQ